MSAAKKREDDSVLDLGIGELLGGEESIVVPQEIVSDDASQCREWAEFKAKDDYGQLAEATASYNFSEEKFDAVEIFSRSSSSADAGINDYVIKLLARSYWVWSQAYLQDLPIFVLLAPYEGLVRDVMQLIDNRDFFNPDTQTFYCSGSTVELYIEAVKTLKESIEKIASYDELESDISNDHENVKALLRLLTESSINKQEIKETSNPQVVDIALRPSGQEISLDVYKETSKGYNKGSLLLLACLFVIFLLAGFWGSKEIRSYLAENTSPRLAKVAIEDLGLQRPSRGREDASLIPRRSELNELDSIIYRIGQVGETSQGEGEKASSVAGEVISEKKLPQVASLSGSTGKMPGDDGLDNKENSDRLQSRELLDKDPKAGEQLGTSQDENKSAKIKEVNLKVKPLNLKVDKIPAELLQDEKVEAENEKSLNKKLPSPFARREGVSGANSQPIPRLGREQLEDLPSSESLHYMVVLERTPVKNGIFGNVVTTLYPGDRVQVESYEGEYAKIMAKSGRYGYILKKHLSDRNDFAR